MNNDFAYVILFKCSSEYPPIGMIGRLASLPITRETWRSTNTLSILHVCYILNHDVYFILENILNILLSP